MPLLPTVMLAVAVAFGSALKFNDFGLTLIRPPPGVGVAVGVSDAVAVAVGVAVAEGVGVPLAVAVGVAPTQAGNLNEPMRVCQLPLVPFV